MRWTTDNESVSGQYCWMNGGIYVCQLNERRLSFDGVRSNGIWNVGVLFNTNNIEINAKP